MERQRLVEPYFYCTNNYVPNFSALSPISVIWFQNPRPYLTIYFRHNFAAFYCSQHEGWIDFGKLAMIYSCFGLVFLNIPLMLHEIASYSGTGRFGQESLLNGIENQDFSSLRVL